MKDKKLEENIKHTETFLGLWQNFQGLYKSAIEEKTSSGGLNENFLSTRGLVNARFEDLMDSLGIGQKEKTRRCYPVYQILSIEDLRVISDEKLTALNEWWVDSNIFLYSLLKRFKKKKRRIEKFNKFFYLTKKLLNSGGRR